MNPFGFRRWRADRFADLLDQACVHGPPNRRRPRHGIRSAGEKELTTLVAISQYAAEKLAPQQAAAEPDPRFRADLRAMLVATAQREGVGATDRVPAAGTTPTRAGDRWPRRSAWRRAEAASDRSTSRPASGRIRSAAILGVAAVVLSLSGMSAASGDAMPGDALYGVKRSTEHAQLAFAGTQFGRGQLHLEFARTRLAEARAVTGGLASFAKVLDDMDADTRQGVRLLTEAAVDQRDPVALDAVDAFVADQQDEVAGVLSKVRGDSWSRLLGSLDLLDRVAKRSKYLREMLACGLVASDGSDELGPRPRSCRSGG